MDIAKSNSVCCGTLKITNWGTGLAHWASPGSPNARPRFKIAPKDIYNATSPWFSSSFPIFSPLSLQIKAKMKDFKKKKICPVAQWATLIYQNSQVMQLFSYILCITDFILPQLPHGGFFFYCSLFHPTVKWNYQRNFKSLLFFISHTWIGLIQMYLKPKSKHVERCGLCH